MVIISIYIWCTLSKVYQLWISKSFMDGVFTMVLPSKISMDGILYIIYEYIMCILYIYILSSLSTIIMV